MRYTSLLLSVLLVAATPAAGQNVYFGNLHAHTGYSDGSGTPAEAFAAARAGGLDFLAVTEHNHAAADGTGPRRDGLIIATQPALYAGPATALVPAAQAATQPGRFVGLHGQEVSTISSGNHINVFDAPGVIAVTNGDIPALLAWTAANPPVSGARPSCSSTTRAGASASRRTMAGTTIRASAPGWTRSTAACS